MPKQVNHQLRRQQLINACWTVICEQGLEAVSMRSIATAADCTTGRITHYFSGRDELLIAALRLAHEQASERMLSLNELKLAPRQLLRAVLLEALPLDKIRLKEWQLWLSFWAATLGNSAIAKENQLRYQDWLALLQQLLTKLVKPSKLQQQAQKLVYLIDGLGINATLHYSSKTKSLLELQIDDHLGVLFSDPAIIKP